MKNVFLKGKVVLLTTLFLANVASAQDAGQVPASIVNQISALTCPEDAALVAGIVSEELKNSTENLEAIISYTISECPSASGGIIASFSQDPADQLILAQILALTSPAAGQGGNNIPFANTPGNTPENPNTVIGSSAGDGTGSSAGDGTGSDEGTGPGEDPTSTSPN